MWQGSVQGGPEYIWEELSMSNFRYLTITVYICLSYFILAGFGTHLEIAKAGEKKSRRPIRAYIVHSYENDHVCGVPQGEGVEGVLKEKFGDRLVIKKHFMNTKTVNGTPARMKRDASRVLQDIDRFKPGIVFTIDDNAFREVGLKLVDRDFPVIFSGLNGQPETYNRTVQFLNDQGRPDSNITGVYENLHFETAVNVMKGVNPNLSKVIALLDESPTGRAIRVQLQKEIDSGRIDIQVTFKHVGTMSAFRQAIAEINADDTIQAVYPVVLSVAGESNARVGFKDTLKAFLEDSKKPGMALNFAFARLGLFGGASVDFSAMGRQAGQMGIELLNRKPIGRLPIQSAQEYLITFNILRAKMLGIQIPDELIGAAIIYDDMALMASAE